MLTNGSKPIPSTVRDSTYVLDGVLDNETELPIAEQTTDTAGYTDLVFGLFDLLGLTILSTLARFGGSNPPSYRQEYSISAYQSARSRCDPATTFPHTLG